MRNSTIGKFGAVAAAAACVGVASAQSSGPTGLSVRVGAFFPSSNQANDLSRSWLGVGLDYKLSALSASLPGVGHTYFGLSADWYSFGGDSDLPVALTYNLRQGMFVYSVGIGPDFRNADDLTGNGVGFSGQVAVAWDFSSGPTPIFLQAKYFFASEPELSGLGVYLGARF